MNTFWKSNFWIGRGEVSDLNSFSFTRIVIKEIALLFIQVYFKIPLSMGSFLMNNKTVTSTRLCLCRGGWRMQLSSNQQQQKKASLAVCKYSAYQHATEWPEVLTFIHETNFLSNNTNVIWSSATGVMSTASNSSNSAIAASILRLALRVNCPTYLPHSIFVAFIYLWIFFAKQHFFWGHYNMPGKLPRRSITVLCFYCSTKSKQKGL